MRRSEYFLPVVKETPAEAQIVSHRLMLRAGLVRQASAGIYVWLPLGLRVLEKIAGIVREEQNRAGAVELLMPTIQSAELWRESGRYEDYGAEMLRIRDRHDSDLLYGPTNEEQITQLVRDNAQSYRDFPLMLYHIQWKFRDELRPRFGVMRGREFLMKDTYSFDMDQPGAMRSYQKMFVAYLRTFARMGLHAIPVAADSGPIGGDSSHEFVVLAETGESQIYAHQDLLSLPMPTGAEEAESVLATWTAHYAASDEQHDEARFSKEVPKEKQVIKRGIEVGHIFTFGEKYTRPMNCVVQNEEGKVAPLYCGSYGIGVSRLVGAAIEASHDAAGIIWHPSIAPFHIGLVCLRPDDEANRIACEAVYTQAQALGLEVLYDDREERAGRKFAELDLIGLPYQMVIGPKEAEAKQVELKNRATGEKQVLSVALALEMCQKECL